MFATISKHHLTEVRELLHAFTIWQRLESRFNSAILARAMDLKRLLMNLVKPETQPMDDFLRGVKNIADYLAAIQSAVSDMDLIQSL